MDNIFEQVRQNVTARQAAEFYGMQVDRHSKALCLWHNDKTPSLSFKGGRCHCFACGAGGSAVDVVAQLLGLAPIEAARRIAKDYGLAPVGGYVRPIGQSKAQKRQELETWARRRWAFLCEAEREAYEVLQGFRNPQAWDNPRFKLAIKALAGIQIDLEKLWVAGNDLEQIQSLKKEVYARGGVGGVSA